MTQQDIIDAIKRGDISIGLVAQAAAKAQGDREEHILELARDILPLSDGTLELDDMSVVSEGDANGAYVQTWSWVDFSGTELDKEKEDEDET